MRIAFFVQYCHEAGTYFRWHNLAKELVLSGNQVDIYAGDFNYKSKHRIENRDGVKYYITPSLITSLFFGNPSDPFTACYRCFKKVKVEYDVYHLFQPFMQAFLPWYLLKITRKALFVYDWDDLWAGGLISKPITIKDWYTFLLVREFEKRIPNSVKYISTCSTYLSEKFSKDVNHLLLYNGFKIKLISDSKFSLRAKFKLDPAVFYIAYIGKTAGELEWIKDGIYNLDLTDINYKLIIAGPGFEQVKELGFLDNPKVDYKGELIPDDAAALAKAVDLGLIPLENSPFNKSRFPIKFFDFLSVGTPVFFSRVGEISNIAKHIDGAFEGSDLPHIWAQELPLVVENITNNPVIINVEHLAMNYSWKSLAKKLESFYKS